MNGILRADRGGDVLTSVLDALRLRGRVFCRSELVAPWGLRLPRGSFAHFHVIERGGAWLRIGEQKVALAAGDLALVPHGTAHVLADAPDSRAMPLADWESRGHESAGQTVLTTKGQGAATHFFCGSFTFERKDAHPLLALLPNMIHVRSSDERAAWLQLTLRALQTETREGRPGAATVISRLLDVMLVEALRVFIAALPEGAGGWLGALRDPQLSVALAAIHRAPDQAWTIERLAREAGQSRSVFAERFRRLVGDPPLAYLTAWRMSQAAAYLADQRLAVGEVAERVGYESEAAFARAFKRKLGVSPGACRRSAAA